MASTVHVSNLSWSTTDDTLREMFSPYGTIVDSRVDRDPDSGRATGTGSVTFSEHSEAQVAVGMLDGQHIDDSRINASLT
ncbi:RNA recognition motif domain-containing protein [Streptomyces microflavus]|uniref:RNA-binding protein n=1 Tax=Streptomyces microflavus TaxID=1919 RepID=A0ABV1QE75_STRMI